METIQTGFFVENRPLFVTHYTDHGTIHVRLHDFSQDPLDEQSIYGLVEIETHTPTKFSKKGYTGSYLARFYIFKETVKGMGKYILCVAVALLLKKENFNKMYLRAYGTRYDRTLQNKLLEGPAQDIYDYYLKNDAMNHLYEIGEDFVVTKENIISLINQEPYLKEDLSGFAARIEETKRLVKYYSKEYNFVVIDDTDKVDIFMESSLDALKKSCLTNKGYIKG